MPRDVTYKSSDFVYTKEYITDPPNHPNPFGGPSEHVTSCVSDDSWRGDIVISDHRTPTTYSCKTLRRRPKYFSMKGPWTLGYHGGWFWYREHLHGLKAPSTTVGELDASPWDARFPDHHSSAATSICLQKILNNDFDLGETLAEVRSNASLIADLLLRVVDLWKAYRSKDPAAAKRALSADPKSIDEWADTAANAYLAFRFGVIPLAETIYGAWDAILKAFENNEDYLSAYGESSGADSPMYGLDSLVHSYDGELEVGAKVGVLYKITDPSAHALAALRIASPLTIAWAALPLSFVLDWFIHVGQVLSGLTAPMGLTFHSGYETRWRRGSYTATEDVYSFWSGWGGTHPSVEIEVNAFGRRTLVDFPKPSVFFTLDLDLGKVVTGMALLKQRG